MKKSTKIILISFLFIFALFLGFIIGKGSLFVETLVDRFYPKEVGQSIEDQDYSKINNNIESLLDTIDKQYLRDADPKAIETGIYKGILESLDDPYSVYYNEEEFTSLMEDTQGSFGGIGIQVSANENGMIEVIAPIKGTPGAEAGILPGDFITQINGEKYTADQLDQAVKVMRGKEGEDVTITIVRGQGANQEIMDLTITRAIINVQSVHAQMLDGDIAYVLLTGFQEKTDEDFIKAVDDLIAQGAKSLILDLRNNPGGLLDTAMHIADYLLDKGTVISVRYKDESNNEELAAEDGKIDLPMTVLINKGSASASEVLSGALQDHKRATLVGETSYGKGVIQQMYPIFNGGKREGLKLTVAEFYTPNGHQIHGKGITPDYEVKLPEDVTTIGVEHLDQDTQLQKAIDLLK